MPEATGGSGDITYFFAFSPDTPDTNGLTCTGTHRLTGTPLNAGRNSRYTITATDEADQTATTRLSVSVIEDVCSATTDWHPIDSSDNAISPDAALIKACNILLSAKDDLIGTMGTDTLDWDVTTPMSDWDGIDTSQNDVWTGIEVKLQIDVQRRFLCGSIPPELGALRLLGKLELGAKQIYDSSDLTACTPTEFGLTGSIPPELGQLSTLENLNLTRNRLSGEIPPELGQLSALRSLSLYVNQLEGEIPEELGSLSQLESLRIDDNQLSGEIPPELGQLSKTEFRTLDLSTNDLEGEIPEELGSLSKMRQLKLGHNDLTGEIPEQLGGLSNLAWLYLNDNKLSDPIPEELGSLSSLWVLYLNNNQLSGNIPRELGNLSELEELSLDNNELTGEIPPELGSLSNLYALFLNDNQLTEGIPAAFADVDPDTPEGLTALTYLTLYNNLLTTPATFIVAPSDSTVRLPLSESDGATEFTAQVEIDDPGTLWASGFADPLGLEDDNLATGAITASLSGTADVVVVAVAPDSYDFAIGAAETITGDLTFTLTPTANGVDQDDETVTFSVSGMGAPGGTGTMLAAEAIEVVVENNDALPTPTPPTIRRPPHRADTYAYADAGGYPHAYAYVDIRAHAYNGAYPYAPAPPGA